MFTSRDLDHGELMDADREIAAARRALPYRPGLDGRVTAGVIDPDFDWLPEIGSVAGYAEFTL